MAENTQNKRHALKVHHLRPAPGSHQAKTRLGRGEASKGKTAGRGTKGCLLYTSDAADDCCRV